MKIEYDLLRRIESDLGLNTPFVRGQAIPIKNCWHFSTDGNAVDVIFKDDEDFRAGMNRIYIVVGKHRIIILAFALMDTHLHFILYGDLDACSGIPFTAWHYPWSSGPLYSSPAGLWSSPKWTDESSWLRSSQLTQFELIHILKARTVPPEDVRIIDGMVFPGEYVAYKLVERMFKTRKSFNYILLQDKRGRCRCKGRNHFPTVHTHAGNASAQKQSV